MLKTFKRLFIKLLLSLSVGIILLIITLLNPTLLYSHETKVDQVTILHDQALSTGFTSLLEEVMQVVKSAEIYDPAFSVQLCLSDGSLYPELITKLKGPGFGHGFYNIALISSQINTQTNRANLNGYSWNLKKLLIHEILHTYQFNRYGFKTLGFDQWKIEGYPEYISRESSVPLKTGIERLIDFKGHWPINDWVWIMEDDGSGLSLDYLKNHLLVRFILEERQFTYSELLSDTTSKESTLEEMMEWYEKENKINE